MHSISRLIITTCFVALSFSCSGDSFKPKNFSAKIIEDVDLTSEWQSIEFPQKFTPKYRVSGIRVRFSNKLEICGPRSAAKFEICDENGDRIRIEIDLIDVDGGRQPTNFVKGITNEKNLEYYLPRQAPRKGYKSILIRDKGGNRRVSSISWIDFTPK